MAASYSGSGACGSVCESTSATRTQTSKTTPKLLVKLLSTQLLRVRHRALLRGLFKRRRRSRHAGHRRPPRSCSSTPCMHLSLLHLRWGPTHLACSTTPHPRDRHRSGTPWMRPPLARRLCQTRPLRAIRQRCQRLTTSGASTLMTAARLSLHQPAPSTRHSTATPGKVECTISQLQTAGDPHPGQLLPRFVLEGTLRTHYCTLLSMSLIAVMLTHRGTCAATMKARWDVLVLVVGQTKDSVVSGRIRVDSVSRVLY